MDRGGEGLEASPGPAWLPWTVGLAAAAVTVAGLDGLFARVGVRLGPAAGGAGALLALVPLAGYAWAMERGRPAPALRGSLAPWALFVCVEVGVQLGGPTAPWAPLLPWFAYFLARHAPRLAAAGATALAVLLAAYPAWAAIQEGRQDLWGAVALPTLLLLAYGLGRLGGVPRTAPSEASPRKPADVPARPDAASPAPTYPLPVRATPRTPMELLDADLDAALDQAFGAHPDWGALSLWWGGDGGVSLRKVRLREGFAASAASVHPGEGLLGLALRERRALAVAPLAAGAPLPYALGARTAGSLLVLPLEDEGTLVGLLAADRPAPEPFDAAATGAVESLGRTVVGHAQRAAHLERLSADEERTRRLHAASQALSLGLEREELLARFGAHLTGLVPCGSWVLGLRPPEGADGAGTLEREAGAGYREDAPRVLSLGRPSALLAALESSEGALLVNAAPGAQAPPALAEGLDRAPEHVLLAPLRLGGRLVGLLKLDRDGAAFSEEEREAASIFAAQAAAALEHARLYALNRRLATTDGLTGLANHRTFQERLAAELAAAARSGRPLALALGDIDHFKRFNDSFGHPEGDRVLRQVGALLKEGVRADRDLAARYGGEEFALILVDCPEPQALERVERLRAACAERLRGGTPEDSRPITLSLGLAVYPRHALDGPALIQAADAALYRAKHEGRNRVCAAL